MKVLAIILSPVRNKNGTCLTGTGKLFNPVNLCLAGAPWWSLQLLHYAASIGFYSLGDKVKVFAKCFMGSILILTSQPTVFSYICIQNSSKFTRQAHIHLKMNSSCWQVSQILARNPVRDQWTRRPEGPLLAEDRLLSQYRGNLLLRKLTLKLDESAAIADPKATPVIVMPALSRHPLQLANALPGLRPADSGGGLIMDSGFRRNDRKWPIREVWAHDLRPLSRSRSMARTIHDLNSMPHWRAEMNSARRSAKYSRDCVQGLFAAANTIFEISRPNSCLSAVSSSSRCGMVMTESRV